MRRDVSINLGLYTDPAVPPRRQSILRSWRRLSSLQRLIIIFLLLITVLIALYVLPSQLHNEMDISALEHLEKNHNQGNLPQQPKPVKHKEDKSLDETLEDLKRKAESYRQRQNKRPVNNKDENQEQIDEPFRKDEIKDPSLKDNGPGDENQEQIIPPVDEHEKPTKYDFFNGQSPNEKQMQIREAFKHAWKGYKKYAWGHDELLPISRSYSEWFQLGLTIVDALDTAIIMGLKDEYEEGRQWIAEFLTFDRDRNVNMFEVTIRVLGSLLTCYHLTGDEVFKSKAIDLGDRLLQGFNHRSKIPYSDVNLGRGTATAPRWGPDSSTSEVTTIQLEFRDLSYISGDPKYKDAVHEVSMHVHDLPKTEGLVPIFINADSGQFRASSTITLGARADTYYEYLLKQWIQSGGKLTLFKDDFEIAVQGMRNKLIKKSKPSNLVFVGELLSGRNFSPKMDHLACFISGTLALAYQHGLGEGYLDLAKDIADTCWQMYNRMPTKLSPEITYFNMAEGAAEDLIVKPLDSHNLLRPETLESFFVLFRLTGDQKYRDWGWTIFQAFEKHTRVAEAGYSSINNVKDAGNPRFRNKMESFFLAETLKYLYLLFSDDPKLISLDQYVFNSEAHPLPIYHNDKM